MIKITTFVITITKPYTENMIKLVKATLAKKPKTTDSRKAAYLYACILIVFALAQLFNFQDFLTLLNSFWLPGGEPVAHLTGAVIVVSEVFALPFLLEMPLSPLMRAVSMVFGWIVPIAWLKLSLWLVFTTNAVSNIGFLGTAVSLTPGWWNVFFSIALSVLAAWVSWGLWPFVRKHKS